MIHKATEKLTDDQLVSTAWKSSIKDPQVPDLQMKESYWNKGE